MDKEELEKYNFGYINGFLSAMARVNDKTNHGYDFMLTCHNLTDGKSFEAEGKTIFSLIAEEITFVRVEDYGKYLTNILLKDWLYEFQEKEGTGNYHLADSKSRFSLSDEEWKVEWVEEFVQKLVQTTAPKDVYEVRLGKLKEYYANDFKDILLVNDSLLYRLHLSVSD